MTPPPEAGARPPDWIKPGAECWYEPSPGVRFAGIVARAPWLLGGQTWVTRVEPISADYSAWKGSQRTAVSAAACDCLYPMEQPR